MIWIEKLCKTFDEKTLFKDFSLTIENGEFVILSGASGCGKTTLLNMIGSIEPIDSGSIIVDDIDVSIKRNQREYLKTKVGFLFQNFALIENKTVEENLDIVKNDCKTEITINEALNIVNLSEKINTKVYKLSGGEQQRVALARLLIKKCDIILADEPTGSLDKENAIQVMGYLDQLNSQGKTVVVVTHDEEIKNSGRRVIQL